MIQSRKKVTQVVTQTLDRMRGWHTGHDKHTLSEEVVRDGGTPSLSQ